MKKLLQNIIILPVILSGFIGCSSSEKATVEQITEDTDTRYMSATGSDFMREELRKGVESVYRIQSSVGYRTYQFDLDDLPEKKDLVGSDLELMAVDTMHDNNLSAGSAVVLSNSGGKTLLLTASHIVAFPDTIWHYAEGVPPGPQSKVEAVSINVSTSRTLIGHDGIYNFDIAVKDPSLDLALLVQDWGDNDRPDLVTLQLETGRSDALNWTDQVFAVGYPLGIQMVTNAMISRPARSSRRNFAFDASINRGFSGGAIFAKRGDGSGMEWVGVVSSASGVSEEYLVPERRRNREYHPDTEYDGSIYVQRSQRINYGIAYGVGIDQVRQFIRDHRHELRTLGISLTDYE